MSSITPGFPLMSGPQNIVYQFTVPGQPVPKGRPRHSRTGGTYTPARTEQAEAEVAAQFRMQIVGYGPPRLSNFALSAMFHMKRDDADIDNLLKLLMDGLQGVAWVNDKQVRRLGYCAILVDRGNPRTEVAFTQLT